MSENSFNHRDREDQGDSRQPHASVAHASPGDFAGVGGDHHGEDGEPGFHQEKPDSTQRSHSVTNAEPTNLAEQKVAASLRIRESHCSANCGSGSCGTGGGCSTGGCGVGSIVELILNEFDYQDERRIIEVLFKGGRREFIEVPDLDLALRVRDFVLVQGERGLDLGNITMTGSLVHAKRKAKRLSGEWLPVVLHKATAQEIETHSRDYEAEREAMEKCRERVEHYGLQMNLVGAEWQFDHRRITFFFTAEGRVDFRELVRDLAGLFHTRIELRQIAVRDQAKRIGGMGICGRELCCTTFLGRYEHITLDHAKIQQMQINPTKLSGLCGRLKCCLLYEIDSYVEGLKKFPPLDSYIYTQKGEAIIQKIDVFRDILYLFHPHGHQFETLTLDELKALMPRQAELRRAGVATADR